MITFVYADHRDQNFEDKFHYAVCNIFEEIRRNCGTEVEVLVDPHVTSDLLLASMSNSDFLFYWGHGDIYKTEYPVIFGSRMEDTLRIIDAGKHLKDCVLYIDGCSLGTELQNKDFPSSLLITPFHNVSYKTSVSTGCRCVLELVGKKKDFRGAFEVISNMGDSLSYKLIGNGSNKTLDLSIGSRLAIASGFLDILLKWNELNE